MPGETVSMGPDDQPGRSTPAQPGAQMPGALQPPEPPQDSGPSGMLIGGIVALVAALGVLGFVVFSGGDDDGDGGGFADDLATADATTEPEDETDQPSEPDATDNGETDQPDSEGTDQPEPPAEETPAEDTEDTPSDAPLTTEQLAQSVVNIALQLNGQTVCTGSGTIIDADGTILTNSHVIDQNEACPHDTIAVGILDVPELPAQFLFEADLLAQDVALDLAVIRIARTNDGSPVTPDFPALELGDSDLVQLGDQLRVIGYPAVGGETITFTEGTVSGFVSLPGVGDRSWLKTDATISGGNSGGLAANDAGQIVGVPTIAGTGNGRITDCRVVEDTNGDGAIDNNDSCVPIGGFINGIRPINLALPLIEQARTAAPIDQGPPPGSEPVEPEPQPFALNPIWTTGIQNGAPVNDLAKFRRSDTALCLVWEFRNVDPGSPVELVWQVDGQTIPEAGFVGSNQGDSDGGFFGCFENPNGIGGGLFELAWFVNDEVIFTHAIYVGGGRDEHVVEIANETESDICLVQYIPTDSLTYGLNHITEPLPPGGVIALPVVTGSYRSRVIDCDGAVRFEDDQGFRIEQNERLTVR